MSGLGRSWRRRPSASYRLQFNRHFGFQQALDLLPYLNELGISDCYASPLFQARPESLHGYDVCDFARLNPDLGAPEDFERFCAQLHQKNMGLLLDIVPNHMGIDLANPWWIDVLENGQASRYAEWFDIDWYPQGLEGKVLLPILEDHYGKVLEAGKLLLKFESGEFRVAYYDRHFPLSARSYPELLNELAIISQKRPNTGCLAGEFQTLLSAFDYEKSRDPDSTAKLQKLKQRLATLIQQSKDLDAELVEVLAAFNGRAGDAHSFDKLHALLQQQHYRLAYWHVAPEQINYRRFFDVSELISLRMELPEVFETTHELVLQWIHEGKVTGLRIDHPDGLWNPKEYLNRIQASVQPSGPPLYIVVEKILTGDESLPLDWPAAGTTGYDFLNQVNGLFVNKENRNSFDSLYREFTQTNIDFETIVNTSKKQVLLTSFLSELDNLTRRFHELAIRTRAGQDFTFHHIQAVLVEVIACFPVYRTYIDEHTQLVTGAERAGILHAIHAATKRTPSLDIEILQFLERLLLLEMLKDSSEPELKSCRAFIMKFQQLTGPLMAKGLEDTAFYNFNRLISLNEVGGNPGKFGTDLQAFHAHNQFKSEHWPDSLLATATHDTKRGEDARARINVLSEIPEDWYETLLSWRSINQQHKTMIDGQAAPDANDEYLFYQSLLGAWCPEAEQSGGLKQLRERMNSFMLKAVREAKVRSSWTDPNRSYEDAVCRFVEHLLSEKTHNQFLEHFKPLQRRIAFFGSFNSLSQTLLKSTAPGVPDFYQGTELWDFNLVDPDNRRPVDFNERRRLLADLKKQFGSTGANHDSFFAELLKNPGSGSLKLFLMWRTLQFRREHSRLFVQGSYTPISTIGLKHNHVCAFSRALENQVALIVVPRLTVGLTGGAARPPLGPEVWQDTSVSIPNARPGELFRNVVTEEQHLVPGPNTCLPLGQILSHFPVALLNRE